MRRCFFSRVTRSTRWRLCGSVSSSRSPSPTSSRPQTFALADRIAANGPIGTQAAKAALRAALSTDLATGMQMEEELIALCLGTEDAREGMSAFLEKRPPEFKGS